MEGMDLLDMADLRYKARPCVVVSVPPVTPTGLLHLQDTPLLRWHDTPNIKHAT